MVATKAIIIPAIFAVLGEALPHANSHGHGHAHAAIHLKRQQYGSVTGSSGPALVTEPADMDEYNSMMAAYNSSISAYEASVSAYAASILATNSNANSAAITSSAAAVLSTQIPTLSSGVTGPTTSITFGSEATTVANKQHSYGGGVRSSAQSYGGAQSSQANQQTTAQTYQQTTAQTYGGGAASSTTSSETTSQTGSSSTGGSSNSTGGGSGNFGDTSYVCYGGIQSKYPTDSEWISLEAMISNYETIVANANPSVPSGACDTLSAACKSAEEKYGLDARVIFALALQESGGGQFNVQCTGTDCGMMQTDGGCSYGSSCTVQQMINEGVGGTSSHPDGVAALVKSLENSIWYAARVYNSGSLGIDKSNLDKSDTGTLSYVNDMANRLIGWVPSGSSSPWCNACPHVAAGGVCN